MLEGTSSFHSSSTNLRARAVSVAASDATPLVATRPGELPDVDVAALEAAIAQAARGFGERLSEAFAAAEGEAEAASRLARWREAFPAAEVMGSDVSRESLRMAADANPGVRFVAEDADTREEDLGRFDLVIGNPPYGRVTPDPMRRAFFQRSVYGHANLYGVFTDIALRWTKPGGVIAYLTPTSALGGQYFVALRKLLAKEAPPVAIDFVHARKGVFEDVLQETLLALYQRGARPSRRSQ